MALPAAPEKTHEDILESVADRISPSRVNRLLECGISFKRHYIDGEPERRSTSHALFGTVMHSALEVWALDRDQSLRALVEQAWFECTADAAVVQRFIKEYQALSPAVIKAEEAAAVAYSLRNKGAESKKPRMTKEFKASLAYKKLAKLLAVSIPKLDKDSPWRFTASDPLPTLYDESLRLADVYGGYAMGFPTPLWTELKFDVEWRGFNLTGLIDTVELHEWEGKRFYALRDYKTYRREPTPFKDWRQGAMYYAAFVSLMSTDYDGLEVLPVVAIFDYVRLRKQTAYVFTEEDMGLLEADLLLFRKSVLGELFLPADKQTDPEFCSYGEDCCMVKRGEAGRRVEL